MDLSLVDFQTLLRLHLWKLLCHSSKKRTFSFIKKNSTRVDHIKIPPCDQIFRLTRALPKKNYPKPLHRVHLIHQKHNQTIILLTSFKFGSAGTIGEYCKSRHQIELFFKWIKQNSRVKAFYRQSLNAVKTQISKAICSYLIILIIQRMNHFNVDMHPPAQVLCFAIMGRMTLKELIFKDSLTETNTLSRNLLELFNFKPGTTDVKYQIKAFQNTF